MKAMRRGKMERCKHLLQSNPLFSALYITDDPPTNPGVCQPDNHWCGYIWQPCCPAEQWGFAGTFCLQGRSTSSPTLPPSNLFHICSIVGCVATSRSYTYLRLMYQNLPVCSHKIQQCEEMRKLTPKKTSAITELPFAYLAANVPAGMKLQTVTWAQDCGVFQFFSGFLSFVWLLGCFFLFNYYLIRDSMHFSSPFYTLTSAWSSVGVPHAADRDSLTHLCSCSIKQWAPLPHVVCSEGPTLGCWWLLFISNTLMTTESTR